MPRYHFNIEDGYAEPDPDGLDLPDLGAARVEAARTFGELLRDKSESFWMSEDWRMEVTDSAGLTLFCLHLVGVDAPVVSCA